MKAAAFEYHRVSTVEEALAVLAEGDGYGKVLAGGQSLGPMMNLRLVRPDVVVDIGGVRSLTEVTSDSGIIRIGARVTHSAIEDGVIPGPTGVFLSEVAHGIAYRAIRNRGTLGGSLVHAAPAADWLSVLIVLDASVVVVDQDGETSIKVKDFVVGPFTTGLGDKSLVSRIEFKELTGKAKWSYLKSSRKPGEFADAISICLRDESEGIFRITAGAMDVTPKMVDCNLSESNEEKIESLISHRKGYQKGLHCTLLQRSIHEVKN